MAKTIVASKSVVTINGKEFVIEGYKSVAEAQRAIDDDAFTPTLEMSFKGEPSNYDDTLDEDLGEYFACND